MEKLELKHLAPYLPYGLKYFVDYTDGDTEIVNLDGAFIDELYLSNGLTCGYQSETSKPILRPLSDLTKNEFVDDLGKWYGDYQELDLDDIDYGIVKNYFKHHFDVFGLIEKGLAIDINTIK